MDEKKKEEFHKFIDESLNSKTNFRRFTLSEKIPDKLAGAIKEIMGVDVSDYQNEIYENIVRHIEKRHGKHGEADHSMANIYKLDRINEFMGNFNQIKKANENKLFKNSDGSHAKTIEISKKYNNKLGVLIEAIPQNGRKSIETVTMYYKKIENTEQVPDNKGLSPGHTPKTQPTNTISSMPTINYTDKIVNSKIKEDTAQVPDVNSPGITSKTELAYSKSSKQSIN